MCAPGSAPYATRSLSLSFPSQGRQGPGSLLSGRWGPSTEPEPQPQQRPARSRRMSASSQGGVSSGAALLHTPARGAAPRGKRQEGRSAGAVPGGADLRAKSVCCSWPSGPVRAGAGSSAERVLDFFYTWGCFGPPARYLCQHPLNCCFSQFLLRFFAF